MAQELIHRFVAELAAHVELPEPIVEFGSMQVEEGQTNDLRELFRGRSFLGTDMREGPGVDRVEDLRGLTFDDGTVGTAICLDTLEHCADPPAATRELQRVVAPGGICVITSVMLFGIHGYPNDYYRFTPEAFRLLLSDFDDVWVAGIGDPSIPFQVVGVGSRDCRLGLSLDDFPSLAAAQDHWERARGSIRVGPLRVPVDELLRLMRREFPRAAAQTLRDGVRR